MLLLTRRFLERFAYNALGMQNYEKAITCFRKIVEAFPDEKGTHYNYAVSLIGAGKTGEAEIHLIREIAVSGQRYEVLLALGELCYAGNKRSSAETYLKKALELCADEKAARLLREKLAVTGDPERYRDMIKGYGLFEEGARLLDTREWEKARTLFLEALKLDPGNPMTYNNLGVIALNHENQPETARAYFEKASHLSDLMIIKRNMQKAVFHIEKARASGEKTFPAREGA